MVWIDNTVRTAAVGIVSIIVAASVGLNATYERQDYTATVLEDRNGDGIEDEVMQIWGKRFPYAAVGGPPSLREEYVRYGVKTTDIKGKEAIMYVRLDELIRIQAEKNK